MPTNFWMRLDELARTHPVVIDRPRGSTHPRYPDVTYPLDYGYLEGTVSGDGHGIDVWVGGLPGRPVTAIICTLDLTKRDAEIKVLLGCTPDQAQTALRFHNDGRQSALLVERPSRPRKSALNRLDKPRRVRRGLPKS
jgi:inorganic pyrophosphatase